MSQDKALLDQQESQVLPVHQAFLGLLVHLEKEDSWACLVTKGHRELEVQGENLVPKELKEFKELAYQEHPASLGHKVNKGHQGRAEWVQMDSKGHQVHVDILVSVVKLVLLGQLAHANNVLRSSDQFLNV